MLLYGKKQFQVAVALMLTLCLVGCQSGTKKEPKPKPQATTVVDDGNADARGKGEGQSDVPLVIGSGKLSKAVNPFVELTDADRQAVDLTQMKLVVNDRNGQIVYHAIDGEVRAYGENDYTYYGPADIDVDYNEIQDETTYTITLREDLSFSDSEKVTIDDVIFTMYVMCDSDYRGEGKLAEERIKGLSKYQHGKAKRIAGIRRTGDYQMILTTEGHDWETIYSLRIPICPLHYYGDEKKYNYAKGKFGFTRGDLSDVVKERPSLLGAGAYRFVKYEKQIAYFASNETYYQGCPKIAYIQLKEMDEILEEDHRIIAERIEEGQAEKADSLHGDDAADESGIPGQDHREGLSDSGGSGSGGASSEKDASKEAFNYVPEVTEVVEGTVDVISMMADAEQLSWIYRCNSNQEPSGDVIDVKMQTVEKFYAIGVNAERVMVGSKSGSKKSRYLRYALAKALRDSRDCLDEIYGDSLQKLTYPYAPDSWLSPSEEDAEANREKSVLSYLKKAGFRARAGKVVAAPKSAEVTYSIGIAGGREHPVYPLLKKAADTLHEVGMELRIVSVENNAALGKKLYQGKVQLWVEEYDVSRERSLREKYMGKQAFYGIEDSGLDEMLRQSQSLLTDDERKECYQRCFERIASWGVEVPLFQQRSTTLVSSERIDIKTMPQDITPYYGWIEEIHKIQMK